jgi:3-oxoacyl-[acyl-carrier protein] reductase
MLARAGSAVGIGFRRDAAAAEATLAAVRGARLETGPDTPTEAWAEPADLTDAADVDRLFERCDAEFGGTLDIFVGNAGVWNPAPCPLTDLELSEWHGMLAGNLTSVFLSTRAAARRMNDGGRIILISSTAAQRGEAGHAHYAASKGAVQSLVKSLAVELGPAGITVNAVAPGWVETDMTASVLRGPGRDLIRDASPLRRVAGPEDVAGPVLFLSSDLARHVTGEILNVNGGAVLCG